MGKRKLRRQRDEARAGEAGFASAIKGLRAVVQFLPWDTPAQAVGRKIGAIEKRAEHAERDAATERGRTKVALDTNEKMRELLCEIAGVVNVDPETVTGNELPGLVAAHIADVTAQRDALAAENDKLKRWNSQELEHGQKLLTQLAAISRAIGRDPETVKPSDAAAVVAAHIADVTAQRDALAAEIAALAEAEPLRDDVADNMLEFWQLADACASALNYGRKASLHDLYRLTHDVPVRMKMLRDDSVRTHDRCAAAVNRANALEADAAACASDEAGHG